MPQTQSPKMTKALLVDPSEKGALPLYTSMIAESLLMVGLKPIVLANCHLKPDETPVEWRVLRWLPAGRWPRPAGIMSLPIVGELLRWIACAATIVISAYWLKPSVIHIQYPLHTRLDWLLIRTLSRKWPVLWTAHEVLPHHTRDDEVASARVRAAKIFREAAIVIVHSEFAADQVMDISGVSAVTIPHPVPQLRVLPTKQAAREHLGLPQNARIVGALGFIRAYKNYALLADAWEIMGDQAPFLLVMGELVDQSEQEAVDKLAGHLRVQMRLGYASDDDIISAAVASDIIALPHKGGSDSGALHLARAVQTPVICSDTPQLGSVARATGAGIVLPRDATMWAATLLGSFPGRLGAPPDLKSVGAHHREAYRRAR